MQRRDVVGSPYAISKGSLSAATNYDLTFVRRTLTITPKPITVTANHKTRCTAQADPALTYTVTAGISRRGDVFSGALTRAAARVAGSPYAITQGSSRRHTTTT